MRKWCCYYLFFTDMECEFKVAHADRRIELGFKPMFSNSKIRSFKQEKKKKSLEFEQISKVKAGQTDKLCLSQMKSGYNYCKVRLHGRFKARKTDKHHSSINTRKCSKTENLA